MPFDRLTVLGIPVDVIQEQDLLLFVRQRIETGETARIVTINAEFVVRARQDSAFGDALRSADLATPDGWGVVQVMRHRGAVIERRVGASDFIWPLAEQSAALGHRMFLLGGAPGVAELTGERLSQVFPRIAIAGTYAGSPAPNEEDEIVDLIRRAKADILLVAYGAPEQELWIARNLSRTDVAVGIGVGGTFDYVAGTARRAPVWMRERGLEWSWRLVRQPRRWRRMLALPKFVLLALWDRARRGDAERTH